MAGPSVDAGRLAHLINNFDTSDVVDHGTRRELIAAADRLAARTKRPWELAFDYAITNHAISSALTVCVDLELFQKWADAGGGHKTSAELAQLTGTDEHLLQRLLRLLASRHILHEQGPRLYEPTPFAQALADPRISSWFPWTNVTSTLGFCILPKFLKQHGYQHSAVSTASDGVFQSAQGSPGTTLYEWISRHPETAKYLQGMMQSHSAGEPGWLEVYDSHNLLLDADPSGILLVDVGGGRGHDLDLFVAKHPGTEGRLVLQDFQAVIEHATCDPKVQRIAVDMFKSQPVHGARAYHLHRVLHNWSDSTARRVLAILRSAMKPGYSRLLINEMVVCEPSNKSHPVVASEDMMMMVQCGAEERTEDMWRRLLEECDFRVIKVWQDASAPYGVIEAEVAPGHRA